MVTTEPVRTVRPYEKIEAKVMLQQISLVVDFYETLDERALSCWEMRVELIEYILQRG